MTDEIRDALVIHPWPFPQFRDGFARALSARSIGFPTRPQHVGPTVFVGTDANNLGCGEIYAVVAMLVGCERTPDGLGLTFASAEQFACPIAVNGSFQSRPDLRGDALGFVGEFSYLTRASLERIPVEARALAAVAALAR